MNPVGQQIPTHSRTVLASINPSQDTPWAPGGEHLLLPGPTMAELGLYDDLPLCLNRGEPWVEYGIVEYRYKLLRPEVYDYLVRRYSHTKLGPKQYTASAYIAGALGQLGRARVLACSAAVATGYWSYNGVISSWALPPGPAEGERLSWVRFAQTEGVDPDDWDLCGAWR